MQSNVGASGGSALVMKLGNNVSFYLGCIGRWIGQHSTQLTFGRPALLYTEERLLLPKL